MNTPPITQPFADTFSSAAASLMIPRAEPVPTQTSVLTGPRVSGVTGIFSEDPHGPARGPFPSPHITHRLCVNCDEVLAGKPTTVGQPGANVLREGHCPVCEQTAREHLVILFLLKHLRLTFEQIPPRARVLALSRGWIRKLHAQDMHFVPAGQLATEIHRGRSQSTERELA